MLCKVTAAYTQEVARKSETCPCPANTKIIIKSKSSVKKLSGGMTPLAVWLSLDPSYDTALLLRLSAKINFFSKNLKDLF